MSDRGSPADHTTQPDATPQADAPASAPQPDAASDGGTKDDKSPAASSAAEGAKKDEPKPTLLDVIKTAAEAKPDQGKSPDPAKDGKDKVDPAPKDAATDKDGKPVAPDDTKLPFNNHPRWKEVTGQNRDLKAQVETLTPDAEQYRTINSFMSLHHLTPDEVGEGFITMAMAKNGDPRVLQRLDDFRAKIAMAIGEAIPADIQAKVDSGEISEDAAKELSKARAHLKVSERDKADRDAADANAKVAAAREQLAAKQATVVTAWDAEQRKLDPDFAKKENAIARYARALMQEHGPPPTEAAAVELMKAAYAQVNRDFAAAIPPKKEIMRTPIAPSSNGAKPVPKTLAEAVRQAANG
jgi:hypothetical protein